MTGVRLLDLLGVDTVQDAAELWPRDHLVVEPAELENVIAQFQDALLFENVRPGASGNAVGLWADECVADARTAAVMIRARTRAEIETELFMRGFEGRRDGGGARSAAQPSRQFDLWEKHSQSRFDLPLAAGWWAVGGETRRSRGED